MTQYAVLVADTEIDPQGLAEEEIIGPFPTEEDAREWAYSEQRYIVTVRPLTMRRNSYT